MNWDARQRAMLEAMGYRVPAASAREPGLSDEAAPPAALPPSSPPATAAALSPSPARAPAASPASPSRWDELDADGLRAAVAGCRACSLCEQRKQPVFGRGSERPRWLVVVEPPDESDEAGSETAATKLLANMLVAAGLRPDEAFITPVVKCRPPRGRAATTEELAACQGVLARQVALFQPELVLAMGRQAVQAVTGRNDPLGRMRGVTLSYGGRPLVATYDPRYLLRAPADKAGAWEDLCLARSLNRPLADDPA
jgi:DNA polymerase